MKMFGIFLDTINAIIAYYSLFLIVFGTISNIFGIYICVKRDLLRVPTFVFYSFIFLANTLQLYILNVHYSIYALYGIEILEYSWTFCKFGNYFQVAISQVAPLLLVLMAFERYLSIKIILWRKAYFKSIQAFVVCGIIMVISVCSYIPLLTVEKRENSTSNIYDFLTSNVATIELKLSGFLSQLIPIPTLLLLNVLLVYQVIMSKKKFDKNDKDKARKKSLTISVILSTTAFIVLNLPNTIVGSFFLVQVLTGPSGFTISFGLFVIQYTYLATNFYVLLLTIAKETKITLRRLFRLKEENTGTNIANTQTQAFTAL